MKILIIGQGGREHALAWKMAQSPLATEIYVAPGNGGTAMENKCQNINIAADDCAALLDFAQQQHIDLTVVGPEAPLALGLVDQFHAHGLTCFGPSQAAAQLESSKAFCKQFMQEHAIPTAGYASFTRTDEALNHLQQCTLPIVIKADGLAAGKGVVIATTLTEAQTAIHDMLDDNALGEAGHRVVIETFIQGRELSFIAMVDGTHIVPLASSQDHKRLLDDDQGPNTGGMGAYSPSPLCTPELEQRILNEIMRPTVNAMSQRGTPFCGFLYAGLMIQDDQQIQVLEFNCRLGDPETQPLMMRLQSDLVELCLLACKGQLHQASPQWDPRSALTVVMAAKGYPRAYPKGELIEGLNRPIDGKVFHAGTALRDHQPVTQGGRVLGVTALGHTLADARHLCYQAVAGIRWPHCVFRHDIGAND